MAPITHTMNRVVLIVVALFGLVACQQGNAAPVLMATPTAAPANEDTVDNSNEFDELMGQNRQLVIWVPEFFDPTVAEADSAVSKARELFRQAHPDVHIDIQVKAQQGETGLFNYLTHAQRVAPSILPDIILLDTQQLWQAVDLNLVQPIDWESLSHTNDFFQFAREAVSYQNRMIGVPYAGDIIHLIYHSDQVEQAPATWTDLLTTKPPYFFAAGQQEQPNESLLLQYLGAGGQLFEDGVVSNPEALTQLFTFLSEAQSNGIFPSEVLQLTTFEETWATFVAQPNSLADISASLVLLRRNSLNNLGFAQIPTINGAAISIAHTWAFALVTADEEQQQLSLALLEQLLTPAVQSEWCHSAMIPPTQGAAFELWRGTSGYYDFLQRQLDVAVAIPNGVRFAEFSKRLQEAQEAVLQNQLNPENAAEFVQVIP